MARKRDHYRYYLKKGRKILYIGITNDPERREEQHRKEGKNFTHMHIVGPSVTKESAEKWEEETLKKYRQQHNGNNPRYNKNKK